jgi:hypothetical protein
MFWQSLSARREYRDDLTLPRLTADHRAPIFNSHIKFAAHPEFSR